MLGRLRGVKVKGNERREVYSVDDGRKGGEGDSRSRSECDRDYLGKRPS